MFVSSCVKKAGATATEFAFAASHSVFVHQAIKNAASGTGVFRGIDVTTAKPAVGDIIQNNRGGSKFDFAFAKANTDYPSHSAIVVEIGADTLGPFALTIGGNEFRFDPADASRASPPPGWSSSARPIHISA